MAAVALFIKLSLQAGVRDDKELGFSPDDNGKKAWHSLIHVVWVPKNRKPYPVNDIRPLIVSHTKRCV